MRSSPRTRPARRAIDQPGQGTSSVVLPTPLRPTRACTPPSGMRMTPRTAPGSGRTRRRGPRRRAGRRPRRRWDQCTPASIAACPVTTRPSGRPVDSFIVGAVVESGGRAPRAADLAAQCAFLADVRVATARSRISPRTSASAAARSGTPPAGPYKSDSTPTTIGASAPALLCTTMSSGVPRPRSRGGARRRGRRSSAPGARPGTSPRA